MANALYTEGKNSFLGAPTHSAIDLNLDNIRAYLTDEGTVAFSDAHQDYADIASATVTGGVSPNMTSLAIAAGAWDVANFVWTAVSGATVEAVNWAKWSGVDATSPLFLNIDTATGLPLTPNGGDVNATIHASGVFGF